jgi:hypothetical protein
MHIKKSPELIGAIKWCGPAPTSRGNRLKCFYNQPPIKNLKPPTTMSGVWWCGPGSNRRHKDFQSFALPTELPHHSFTCDVVSILDASPPKADANIRTYPVYSEFIHRFFENFGFRAAARYPSYITLAKTIFTSSRPTRPFQESSLVPMPST